MRVRAVSSDGAGVADLPDGRVVFVHRTAPGDVARVALTRVKRRWARARLLEVVEASPARRAAPCPHYARCGGCRLEHLRYDEQLRWKGTGVADALQRIGGLDVPAPGVRPSPDEFRYRSRVSFHLRRLGGGRVVAGFHELERPGRVVDMGGECLLPAPELAGTWDRVREAWGPGARLLPPGRALRLTLRQVIGGVVLLVEPDGEAGPGVPATDVAEGADRLLETVPALLAMWWRAGDEPPRLLAGDPHTAEEFLERRVEAGPSAFLQVNRAAGEALHRAVLAEVGDTGGIRIVDAYCGVGTWGHRLAGDGATVVGIELDPGAVRAARRDAPPGFTVLEGAVESLLPEALPADTVLANPPRGGLHDDVPAHLLASGVRRIVYVSCDPATLARDVARLAGGYRLRGLRAFDLFPQSAHVETVAVLERPA